MIDLTKEIIVYKVNHLKHILKNIPNILSIINSGSVSSNNFIISMTKERIFCFDPYVIKSRISKFTLGIRVNEKWNELI
jgi:hypothetical protein